jgi:Ca2+-binding EF-hand superfamily protein
MHARQAAQPKKEMRKNAEEDAAWREYKVEVLAERMAVQAKRVTRFTRVKMMPVWLQMRTVLRKPIKYKELSQLARQTIALRKLTDTDLRTMKECFNIFDVDMSGTIDMFEFCELIKETRSPFLDKVFLFIDKNHDGAIDFSEFLHSCSMICGFNRYEMVQFVFYLYDKNGDQKMKKHECQNLIEDLSAVGNGELKYQPEGGYFRMGETRRRASGGFFYENELTAALKAYDDVSRRLRVANAYCF